MTSRAVPAKMPVVCGHRGAAAIEAENTLASFLAAAERGATWVEFDVRPTADRALVLHHDPETSSGRRVAAATRSELDSSIPVFGELIASLPEIGLDLEIKTDEIDMALEEFVALVARELDEHVEPGRRDLFVTSFDVEALALFHGVRPAIATGLLFHDRPADWAIDKAIAHGHKAIAPWYPLVEAEVVARAQGAGLRVLTWTVNEPADVAAVAAAGVDMIIGDDPAVIVEALADVMGGD